MAQQPTLSPSSACGEASARILAAAEQLFAEHGFDAVSINAIAARAEVSKANVFHHFNSKNALYIAVLREACRDSAEDLHHLEHDDRPFPERLADFAREHLSHILERHQVSRLVLREMLHDGSSRGQEMAEKVFGDKFQWFVEILRDGQARGELRADVDPAMVATLLIGANVFFFEARDVLRHFPDVKFAMHPDRYSRMLIDILLRGMLPADAPDKNNIQASA
jgi:TetR/AcrR family transcriptional regulator